MYVWSLKKIRSITSFLKSYKLFRITFSLFLKGTFTIPPVLCIRIRIRSWSNPDSDPIEYKPFWLNTDPEFFITKPDPVPDQDSDPVWSQKVGSGSGLDQVWSQKVGSGSWIFITKLDPFRVRFEVRRLDPDPEPDPGWSQILPTQQAVWSRNSQSKHWASAPPLSHDFIITTSKN